MACRELTAQKEQVWDQFCIGTKFLLRVAVRYKKGLGTFWLEGVAVA